MVKKNENVYIGWKSLLDELARRLKKPIHHPSFVLYFFVIIILIGAAGFWISLFRELSNEPNCRNWIILPRTLSTYLLAILTAGSTELILLSEQTRSLRMFAISTLIIGLIFSIFGQVLTKSIFALLFAILGTAIALYIWWIANSDNIRLLEEIPNANVTTGGDTEQELEGDISDIST